MTVELSEIILHVQDMNAQVNFYQQVLGLKVIEPQGAKDFREFYTVKLQTTGCLLVLDSTVRNEDDEEHEDDEEQEEREARQKLVFRVNNIEATRKELLARGCLLEEVQSPLQGVWVCESVDPEGNTFSIQSGKKRAFRVAPPAIASEAPYIPANSLTGRLVVLLRENKLAIAIEILIMLGALYGIEYYGTELTFTLVVLVIFSLWLRGSNLSALGLKQPKSIGVTIFFGVVAGIILQVLDIGVIIPNLTNAFNSAPNVQAFNPLQGNLSLLPSSLILAWISAGIGEEVVFRGYFLNRFVDLFGNHTWGWIIAIILQAVVFASGHAYQGITGVISAGITGIIFGVMYIASRRNLWLTVVTHGVFDTVSFLFVFFGL
ncbi:MAG: CPBP family glutamic-type intramembrane protease [Ktedonobacteraceae bacterium]